MSWGVDELGPTRQIYLPVITFLLLYFPSHHIFDIEKW
jgi:hypothetical protein